MVALIATHDDESANNIVSQHDTVLDPCSQTGIQTLSLGSDGAANKISAQEKLNHMASNFLTYTKIDLNVNIKVPLFGNPPRPLVTIQDPKHARKTAANQPLSGARLIAIGKYQFSIQQLAMLLELGTSPLLEKYVFDSDK